MNERNRMTSGSHNPRAPLQRARPGLASATSAPPPPYPSSSHVRAAAAAAAAPTTSSRDRTNLFRSHLTRRPTGAAAGGGPSATAVVSGSNGHHHAPPTTAQVEAARLLAAEEQQLRHAEMCEIVVRNQDGDIDLESSPMVSLDDIDEMALEARQETEHERQRLAEAVKQHRINHTTVLDQPEELLEAVRASLRTKVDALADDNWMFEPEEQLRG